MAALRAGDADLAAPTGHAQLLAALGAAVIVIVLALLEPHLLLAKPRGNAVLVGKIFEVFAVPLAGVAAQNAEIAVDDGRSPSQYSTGDTHAPMTIRISDEIHRNPPNWSNPYRPAINR